MAILFADGFDFYNTSTDLIASGNSWALSGTATFSNTTRFSAGRSLALGTTSTTSTATLSATSSNTVYINFALQMGSYTASGTTAAFGVTIADGASNQVGVFVTNGGFIQVTNGLRAGTVLGTSPAALYANSTEWHHLQIKIVINNTTGSVEVHADGNSSPFYTLSSINTRNGSVNTQCTAAILQSNIVGSLFDDFLVFDSSGAAPNTFVGDVRAVQLMPDGTSGTQQWTNNPLTYEINTTATTSSNAGANTIRFTKYIPAVNLTVSALTARFNASTSGTDNMALYADSGTGGPGSLLSACTQQTPTGNNTLASAPDIVFPLVTPQAVTAGTQYWVACMGATNFQSFFGALGSGWALSQTYASGFPASASAATSSSGFYCGVQSSTGGLNPIMVSEAPTDGDTSYVSANSAGFSDLYSLASLGTTPNNIVGVNTRAQFRMDDTGPHTYKTQIKSGATTVNSNTISTSSTYSWVNRFDPTDPNTATTWSAAAINALLAGPVMVS